MFFGVLRCFSSPTCPPPVYVFNRWIPGHDARRVAPFGYPRLSLLGSKPRLIAAMLRPSSAFDAKASPVDP